MAYRLFPSTNGPGSSTDSESMCFGTAFKVTDTGMVLQGYWYWRADSTAPASAAFALWQITGLNAGTYLGSSTLVSTSSLVAGQWNYVPLASPYALTLNTPYKAVIGINGTHNLVTNQFGSGQPYAAGITNGPLTAYSAASGSNPDPYGGDQCTYGTGGHNPATTFPNSGFSNQNVFLDVQADYATTPVSDADTGAGADTGTVAVAVSDADTGAGADSGAAAVAVSGADTGAGADSGTAAVAVSDADTGRGVDAESAATALSSSDTGAGADTGSVAVAVAGSDTAAGTGSGTVPGGGAQTQIGVLAMFL